MSLSFTPKNTLTFFGKSSDDENDKNVDDTTLGFHSVISGGEVLTPLTKFQERPGEAPSTGSPSPEEQNF